MLSGVTRPDPPLTGDERPMLDAWLDYQRATLRVKCEGLDGAALARRAVPPSTLSLLGLVRHMTIVEWWWFDHVFTGSSSPEPISTVDDVDADFNDLDPAGRRPTSSSSASSVTCHVRSPPPPRASTALPCRPRSRPSRCAGS